MHGESKTKAFPQRLKKKKKKIYMNLEKAIIKNHTRTHRSGVRLQFFPSEVTPCFPSKSSVLLHLSSAVVCRQGARKTKEREEDTKYPFFQLHLCPFSLSGAGNLPRNVREHYQLSSAHHTSISPIKPLQPNHTGCGGIPLLNHQNGT